MADVRFAFDDRDRTIPLAEAERLQVDLAGVSGPKSEDAFEIARKLEETVRGGGVRPIVLTGHEERALLEVLDRYEIQGRLTTTLRHLQMALEGERAPDF